ncbi:protein of unknown function DUF23 [Macleaya cordata]|uniref:Glycosyltransferase family 92 protein n=1 Tax=Macleaya cordata TaxID=56857 RepID=A0A200RCQ5_MACCD|nr:protein of unknown function DUF23 [Macleaya cordata]
MKDRRKREVITWSRFFCCTLFMVISCVLFTGFTFSSFQLFRETFHPVLVSPWRNSAMEAIKEESPISPALEIRETVIFPDQVLIFLKYPSSSPLFTKDDLDCSYFPPNSSQPHLKLPPSWINDDPNPIHQFVRCPIHPRGFATSLSLKSNGRISVPVGPTHRWDSLVYEALIDRDNTTIVFVKGLNLRPERLSESSRYECVYGWDFKRPKFLLTSEAVLSVAQEIVRCKTPLSVLNTQDKSVKVSVRVKGRRGILNSVARPDYLPESDTHVGKKHEMCVCTMVRNQARFLREWVMYHARIGVERWFIYDNNSEDPIDDVIGSLNWSGYKITRHFWPWIKTQEAGFAHCALRARDSCEWVGFIDVDEFLYFRSNLSLRDVLRNQTIGFDQVGELRVGCYNFGPSGLKRPPEQGVTVGYTCRMASPERHKSIVRPEVLNSTLINVVHHFHMSDGFGHVNVDRGVLTINHYKYQVWEVFKEKFYRRVATFVADWQDPQNVGSKDRTPGLGTRPVEPPDWSSRFCEVTDTGIRDWVLRVLANPNTKRLPWQD